jgi:dTDP-glucose 4,6-dehydratase
MQIRDWLYVDDHNRGVDLILEKGKPGATYNIGGNNEWTNDDIVHLVCDRVKELFERKEGLTLRFPESPATMGKHPNTLITHIKDRAGHDRRYAIDAKKITTELGYSPAESFETGIQKTLDWFFDHETWWRCLLGEDYREWIDKNYVGQSTKY